MLEFSIKALFLGLLGFLFISMPRAVSAEVLTPQLDDLINHFVQVSLGKEYANLSTQKPVISKWKAKPVHISVIGSPTKAMGKMASRHLSNIAKLTGVKFKQVPQGTPGPGIDLIFVKRAQMKSINVPGKQSKEALRSMASDPTMVCFFLTWHSPPTQIAKAIVVVNIEAGAVRVDRCLLEELTQVMGLPNDVDAYWETLFTPQDQVQDFTPWDKLYLKTLYSPSLRAGMSEAAVRRVIRPIFAKALSNIR